jgi:hypothetical protein
MDFKTMRYGIQTPAPTREDDLLSTTPVDLSGQLSNPSEQTETLPG